MQNLSSDATPSLICSYTNHTTTEKSGADFFFLVHKTLLLGIAWTISDGALRII